MTSSGNPSKFEKDIDHIAKNLPGWFGNAERDWRYGLTLALLGTALGVYVEERLALAFCLSVAAIAIFVRPAMPDAVRWGPKWNPILLIPVVLGIIGVILRITWEQSSGLKSGEWFSTIVLTFAFVVFASLLASKAPSFK